jgi:hypothetical protein
MKKLLTLAVITAALAFCAPSVKAGIGITTNYTPLNVSFIITTNGPSITNSTGVTQSVGEVKIDSATLLTIFAHWAGTNWPTGAKLVMGWDGEWNGEPLVVDKSGTNVLFNAADTGKSASFFIENESESGPYAEKEVNKDPGSESETYYFMANFNFYDDNVYLPDTDFYGQGIETISYTQNWDKNGHLTTWSQKIDFGPLIGADATYLDVMDAALTGEIDSSGSGTGANYWYANQSRYNMYN